MADISVERKKGGELTPVWAGAAILAVVGLMVWLFTTQPPPTQVVTTGETTTAAAEEVPLSVVGAAPDQYVGQSIIVQDVPVTVTLGTRSFWAEVPGANPMLVVVGAAVPDADWVTAGSSATVQGTIQPVTEAEIDQLIQGQAMHPDARQQAVFASHYLLVSVAAP